MWRCRVSGLRPIAGPFVAAVPAGTRVRARLRVSLQDEAVLWVAGTYLGSLAGRDLAARCAEAGQSGRRQAHGGAVAAGVPREEIISSYPAVQELDIQAALAYAAELAREGTADLPLEHTV